MATQRIDTDAIAYLRSPQAIRDRSQALFDLALADQLPYFRCDLTRLPTVADYVIQVTCAHYPDLNIPFHSRWRHFEVGDRTRLETLASKLAGLTAAERAWAEFDLAIISVLLDAGAGADWHYQEPGTEKQFRRSEGLAVASFHLFCSGAFSSDPMNPLQVDAPGLQQLTEERLAIGLQVSHTNPLVGLQGRVNLLRRLGEMLYRYPHLFGAQAPRPGYLVNHLRNQASQDQLAASKVLNAVLEGFSEIWEGRITVTGVNLGDVWRHSALPDTSPTSQLIPFHKLSQWLTYSLFEPLQKLGLAIADLDELTGLPEYRNGGLCLDLGLLSLKNPAVLQETHSPAAEVIVEWRALTVILLDQIADVIRQQLNLTADQLPLVKVLQGGTWTAGRQIAAELRPGGVPPLQIASDGTVF